MEILTVRMDIERRRGVPPTPGPAGGQLGLALGLAHHFCLIFSLALTS